MSLVKFIIVCACVKARSPLDITKQCYTHPLNTQLN